MSLVFTEIPIAVETPLTERLERIRAFNDQHRDKVLRDFRIAQRHFDKHPKEEGARAVRPLKLVVTPIEPVLRRSDKSSMREDFESPTCEKMIWLRNLYRAHCPKGMRVDFNCGPIQSTNSDTDPEEPFMPTISFTPVTPSKRNQR